MATLRSGRVRLAADCGAINGLRALLPPAPDAMMDVSAMATAAERFDWHDVLDAALCQEAFAPSDLAKAL
jgi:hypothetical protein